MQMTGLAPAQRELGGEQLQQWVAAEGLFTHVGDEGLQFVAQRFVECSPSRSRAPSGWAGAVDSASKVRLQRETFAVRLVRGTGSFEVRRMICDSFKGRASPTIRR